MTDPVVAAVKAEVKADVAAVAAVPKSLWARFVAWIKSKL